jgi:hypothetical protein
MSGAEFAPSIVVGYVTERGGFYATIEDVPMITRHNNERVKAPYGDALRLAVKLWFELDVGRERVVVRTPQGDKVLLSDTDLLAATRRAIVRAAAEVGKSMEKE